MVDVPGGDALRGALVQPDSYCPIIRGQRFNLRIRMARSRDLPKLSSSCTTVVIGRETELVSHGQSLELLHLLFGVHYWA